MDYHNIFILTLLMIVIIEIFFNAGALGQQQTNSERLQTVVISKDYYDILTNCHRENIESRYEDLLQRISTVERGYVSERLQFIENFEHLHEVLKRLMKVEEDNDNLKSIVKQQGSEIETMKTTLKENKEKVEQLVNASNSLQNDNENFIVEIDNLNTKLDDKMDTQTNTFSDEILEIRQNHSALQNSYDTLEHRLNNISESCNRDTERVVAETIVMKDEIVAINENIENVSSSLSNTKRIVAALSNSSLGKPSIGFTVAIDGVKKVPDNGIIPFSSLIDSYGGGFNTTDGIFYCPHGGLYQFSTSLVIDMKDIWYEFTKNGEVKGYIYRGQHGGWGAASGAIVIRLQKGDKFWMKVKGNKRPRVYYISNFSGVLISV